jgi:hypothetical protein
MSSNPPRRRSGSLASRETPSRPRTPPRRTLHDELVDATPTSSMATARAAATSHTRALDEVRPIQPEISRATRATSWRSHTPSSVPRQTERWSDMTEDAPVETDMPSQTRPSSTGSLFTSLPTSTGGTPVLLEYPVLDVAGEPIAREEPIMGSTEASTQGEPTMGSPAEARVLEEEPATGSPQKEATTEQSVAEIEVEGGALLVEEPNHLHVYKTHPAVTRMEEMVWGLTRITDKETRSSLSRRARDEVAAFQRRSNAMDEPGSLAFSDVYVPTLLGMARAWRELHPVPKPSPRITVTRLSPLPSPKITEARLSRPVTPRVPEQQLTPGPTARITSSRLSPAQSPQILDTRLSNLSAAEIIDQAVEQLHSPRRQDESAEDYRRRAAAAERVGRPPSGRRVTLANSPVFMGQQPPRSTTTESVGITSSEAPLLVSAVKPPGHLVDRTSVQKYRNSELSAQGRTRLPDQGIDIRGPYLVDRWAEAAGNPAEDGERGSEAGPAYFVRNQDGKKSAASQGGRQGNYELMYNQLPPSSASREDPMHHMRRIGENIPFHPVAGGYSVPPATYLSYATDTQQQADRHRAAMHNRLLMLIHQHLSRRIDLPEGVKPKGPEAKSVPMYNGSRQMADLEKWLGSLVLYMEASRLGGPDMDSLRVLWVLQFLEGPAYDWFQRHVTSVMRRKVNWTFEEVITGLFDRFILPTSMQDASEQFYSTTYTQENGVQGFYDELLDHAQNMAEHPNERTIRDVFVRGLPARYRSKLFDNGLNVEYTDLHAFVREAKAKEQAEEMEAYYNEQNAIRSRYRATPKKPGVRRVGTTKMPKTAMDTASPIKYVVVDRTPHNRFGSASRPNPISTRNERTPQRVTRNSYTKPRETKAVAIREPAKGSALKDRDPECWNCGEKGHLSYECKKPKKERLRAAHTEVINGDDRTSVEADDGEASGLDRDHDDQQEQLDEDCVEIEVYEEASDTEDDDRTFLQAMHVERLDAIEEKEPTGSKENRMKIRKVQLRASKEPRLRPVFPKEEKECLATYTNVDGHEAWTLWDSGSTMTGITPSFAEVAKIRVFPLLDPHVLQLGTVGSRSSINYGTEVDLDVAGIQQRVYLDVANFDRYDMIVGCVTMRRYKIQLDFSTNEVVVDGKRIKAVRVPAPDADNRLRRARTVEKPRAN